MKVYFGGGEIGSHRTLLKEANAKHVSISYIGLRRRVNFSRPWLIQDKFWEGVSVFLDSGAYTLNTLKPADQQVNEDELLEIYEHYKDFVNANLDRVDMVSEFDALDLGQEWIEEERDTFWKTVPREKFMAIWHPVWGIPYLNEMASRYEIIGIPATSLEGRELRPTLNSLAAKGTRIHGVAMTKMTEMQSIKWDSVASTSWISPARFGDTIVWTGNALKRYPKKMKDQARKQHRTLFTNEGFDAAAIADDDPKEVLRLSIWSWQQFEAHINRHGPAEVVEVGTQSDSELVPNVVVTTSRSRSSNMNEENGLDGVDTQPESASQEEQLPSKAVVVRRPATETLPVMGIFTPEKKNEEDDDPVPVVQIRSESLRLCNSCFLSDKCPMFEPDANCAYNIPITIRTREQFRALRYGLVEMQAQRVMFMKMAEDVEGGYADPNLTKEMNLLDKMMGQVHQEEQEGFSLTISAKGTPDQAGSGMISRIFGREAGQGVQQIEPVQADDIIEAEIVGDDG